MKVNKRKISIVTALAVILLLILDPNTAKSGAVAGIDLCIKVIIPSLFPFFIVTAALNDNLIGTKIPLFSKVIKLLHMPEGSESLLLLGLIGGYPVGAKLIADTYSSGKISKRTGQILLGYCSNAGPAFIFGVVGILFSQKLTVFAVWGLHILSALITGFMLPRPNSSPIQWSESKPISFVSSFKNSLSTTASVCGWVVVFKVIMAYPENWISDGNGYPIILLAGLLELSNGCLCLNEISSEATRFILCSVFLSFGGLCVLMQTASVIGDLGIGYYLKGKLIQTIVSTVTASFMSMLLFGIEQFAVLTLAASLLGMPIGFFLQRSIKKDMEIPRNILYNSVIQN